MKTNTTNLLRILFGVALGIVLTAGVTNAQPSPASTNNSAQSLISKESKQTTKADEKKPEAKKAPAKKAEKEPTSATVGEGRAPRIEPSSRETTTLALSLGPVL